MYCCYFSFVAWTCLMLMFFQAQKNPKTVDCIMKDLDLNKDDKLDFEEFLPLIVGLSMACEKCYVLQAKKGKKWSTDINVDFFFVRLRKFCSTNVCVSQVKATYDKILPSVCLITLYVGYRKFYSNSWRSFLLVAYSFICFVPSISKIDE